MSFKLYSDQEQTARRAVKILGKADWVYLALECQIGKTHISLAVAERIGAVSVLVVTLKTVVTGRGFEDDYDVQGNTFKLKTINYESAHKVLDYDFDVLIIDEAQSIGAFPKMTKRAEVMLRLKKKAKKVIFLSATPTPESYSQWFHQIFGLRSPFSKYISFYAFKNDWVNVVEKKINAHRTVMDYSDCDPEVNDMLKPCVLSMTYDYAMFMRWVNDELPKKTCQKRYNGKFNKSKYAGKKFRLNDNESYQYTKKGKVKPCNKGTGIPLKESKVEDCIIAINTDDEVAKGKFTILKKVATDKKDADGNTIYGIKEHKVKNPPLAMIEKVLKRDRCIYYGKHLITAESAASLKSKACQLSSGTIKDDEGNTHILSTKKVTDAVRYFKKKKRLALFYFFIGEKELIKAALGDDVTDNISDFQSGKVKHFMAHFTTGKAGIRLSDADELLMINVPHSYEQFYQARQRRSALLKLGKELKVWWAFSSHGIERDVFKVVSEKEDYTLSHYKQR